MGGRSRSALEMARHGELKSAISAEERSHAPPGPSARWGVNVSEQTVEINRIKGLPGPQPAPDPQQDFFWVEGRFSEFAVSRATASALERQLVREPPPQWVVFRDIAGALHRVRSAFIERISESTLEKREAMRAFYRARRAERRTEKDWEDDENL